MKTVKMQLIESLAKKNATHVADTTAWNIHNYSAKSKNSNLAKTLAKLPQLESGFSYLVVVGCVGRSQHSASDLHIFKAPRNGTIGTAEALYREHWFN